MSGRHAGLGWASWHLLPGQQLPARMTRFPPTPRPGASGHSWGHWRLWHRESVPGVGLLGADSSCRTETGWPGRRRWAGAHAERRSSE